MRSAGGGGRRQEHVRPWRAASSRSGPAASGSAAAARWREGGTRPLAPGRSPQGGGEEVWGALRCGRAVAALPALRRASSRKIVFFTEGTGVSPLVGRRAEEKRGGEVVGEREPAKPLGQGQGQGQAVLGLRGGCVYLPAQRIP